MSDFTEFFEALKTNCPPEGRVMFSQFRGDPTERVTGMWSAKILNNPDALDEGANVYLCVSAMKKTDAGWKRRKENFAGGLCLMIDDLGDGPGSKFPVSRIAALPPTALIETSPGNHQAVYIFDKTVRSEKSFNALIDAFVSVQFLNKDTGMKGVTRVFRPPFGVNGKAKYKTDDKPFQVRLVEWNPNARPSYEQICKAFNLRPAEKADVPCVVPVKEAEGRVAAFKATARLLMDYGHFIGEDRGDHRFMHIICPWADEHSDRGNTGTGISQPNPENNWYGGFKCWHASCIDKRSWGDLTDYVTETICVDLLEEANKKGAGQ